MGCKTHTTQYFKSGIEIHPKITITETDSSAVNELRILNKNPYYTMMILFDDFGKWNKQIAPAESYDFYIIWQDVQLFENSSERYTIVTENTDLYSSAWVFDSDKKDCLADSSPIKKAIINYFADGVRSSPISDDFFTAYRFARKNVKRH